MTLLGDGFFYPTVDEERCVHCGKCVNVCPIHQSKAALADGQTHHCYYGWHRNESTRMKSTSGGAFSAIAELILGHDNSAVYGALYDEDWGVCHKGIGTLDGLERLRQSKYVQSDTGNCYSEIKDRLDRDEYVAFFGTPCQADGLRLFLGKEYSRLLLVDFVCHGVTSPVIFKKYIQSLEQRERSSVTSFRFRDKVTKGNVSSLAHTTIVFRNNRIRSSECNWYLRAYMSGLLQRVSCEKCPYAGSYRRSDVTLGDFWGIEDIIPRLKGEFHKGISLLLSSTEKGHEVCKNLSASMHTVETQVSYAFNGRNAQLEKPVAANAKKGQLYSDVRKVGVHLALVRGLGLRTVLLMYRRQCANGAKACLPKRLYGWMVSLKRRFYQSKHSETKRESSRCSTTPTHGNSSRV